MKTAFSRQSQIIIIVFIAGIISLFIWIIAPELKFRQINKQYPLGTPAEVVQKKYGPALQLQKTQNVLPFEPREDEKRKYVFYYINLPDVAVTLDFNYYQELIRVKKR